MGEKVKRLKKRKKKLIADFTTGYAKGWYLVVGTYNYEALDIKYKSKIINGINQKVLTQGDDYCFKEGSIFHDSYKDNDKKWSEQLKHITFSLQVRSVYPNKITEDYIEYGVLTFDLYKNINNKLEMIAHHSIRANEFVKLLKTGVARLSTGEQLELDKLK